MKITRIAVQKRRSDRYSVYIDGKYRLSLAEDQLLDAGLRSGDEITEEYLGALSAQSELGKALDRAYGYLSYRMRSERELRQYLRQKKYDDELIQKVIETLIDKQLLDDQRFAYEWVENRRLTNPRSPLQLKAELAQKGIPGDIVSMVLSEMDSDEEIRIVSEMIDANRLISRYPDTNKLIRYLAGKGFRYDAIKNALESKKAND